MSFILDALKKSENDRQRASGPALFEVKIAPPPNRVPAWTIVVAALLLVNLAVITWLYFREPVSAPAPQPQTVAQQVPATATSVPPVSTTPPPQTAPAPGPSAPAPAVTTNNPLPASPSAGPNLALNDPAPEEYLSDDELPAVAPQYPEQQQHFVRRGTESGLPTYEEVAAQVPQLRLDLHVYGPRPQDRFVMINMQRLREGETTPEGLQVESITPEGAVLAYRGQRFVLLRQ